MSNSAAIASIIVAFLIGLGAMYAIAPSLIAPRTSTVTVTSTSTSTTTSVSTSPPAPVTLTVQMEGGPEQMDVQEAANTWNSQYTASTGITVNVVTLSRTDYFDKLTAELVSGFTGMDIFYSFSYYVGEYANYSVPLNSYFSSSQFSSPTGQPYNFSDMFSAHTTGLAYKGNMYFLPLNAAALTLMYRTDLIKNPPTTWSQFVSLAKEYTQSYNSSSPTKYGAAMEGNTNDAWKIWMVPYWDYGGTYFKQGTFEPVFNDTAGMEAASLWINMSNGHLIPPDDASQSYPGVLAYMQSGEVAMILQWNAAYPTLTNQTASPLVYNKVAMTNLPGVQYPNGTLVHYNYLGDNGLSISAYSPNKAAAFKFLSYLTFGAGSKDSYSPPLASFYRGSSSPYLQDLLSIFSYTKAEPQFVDLGSLQDLNGPLISQMLSGGITSQQIMAKIEQTDWSYLQSKGYFT